MTNESKTLYIPLYGKAIMSKEDFIIDDTAERIYEVDKEAFENVDTSRKLAIYMAMRAMQYDEFASKFIQQDPFRIVIHLGCGLDSRKRRVGKSVMMWYDLDFPDVIDLRKKYYEENSNYTMISSSVTDLSWLEQIDHRDKSVLVIAEGLSMYLSENDMRNLMESFKKTFKHTTFIFDAYSPFAAKMSKYKNPINAVDAKINFAMSDPKTLETDGVKCILNNDIILPKYTNKLKGIDKLRFKFMGRFGKNMYRIFGYEIDSEK